MKIIWTSGTTIGNNIPGSLVVSTVNYDRSVPIVKFGDEEPSIATYGPRSKVITDKNIKDPRQATDLVLATLGEYAYPSKQGDIKIQGVAPLTAYPWRS